MNVSVVIPSAGKGERSGLQINKTLYKLDGQTVIEKTVCAFLNVENVFEIIIPISKENLADFSQLFNDYPKVKIVLGGKNRTESVMNALAYVTGEITLIHDGARPYVTKDLIERVIDGVIKNRSAIAGIPSTDTLGVVSNEMITQTLRDGVFRIQTPQGFYTDDIKTAYSNIAKDQSFLDDSTVYSKFFGNCHIVNGEAENKKLTYKSDFIKKTRVGCGFDMHRLVENRDLILGGIKIPHHKGLLGNSDADVLTHAIMDSMLSACSLRDIGFHFPDSDPQYKGISSILLLKKVVNLIGENGYKVSNISASIMAEKPKLMKYVPKLSTNLAEVINISPEDVGITCTTMEGIGIVGREEGIAVTAYCMLESIH